ncbi:hypothetical protein SALBM135S_05725 [Streptomyces alboniger]
MSACRPGQHPEHRRPRGTNVGVQDIPILSAPQTQQCTENSTQAKGDEPLSHILSDIPLLAGNGVANR